MLFFTGFELAVQFKRFTLEERNYGGGYHFSPTDFDSPNVDLRRWAIIEVSRDRKAEFTHRLTELLRTEPDESNCRHIIRALIRLNGVEAAPLILEIADTRSGLILGEAAEALGRLGYVPATATLTRLAAAPVPHIANRARKALTHLKQIGVGK